MDDFLESTIIICTHLFQNVPTKVKFCQHTQKSYTFGEHWQLYKAYKVGWDLLLIGVEWR